MCTFTSCFFNLFLISNHVEIVRAYEVLSSIDLRDSYDSFIANLPKSFRPIYGRERPAFVQLHMNPWVVTGTLFVMIIWLLSFLQVKNFKSSREKALLSDFYEASMMAAMGKGKTKEQFHAMFLQANPELEHGWGDTVGGWFLGLPFRQKNHVVESVEEDVQVEVDDSKHEAHQKEMKLLEERRIQRNFQREDKARQVAERKTRIVKEGRKLRVIHLVDAASMSLLLDESSELSRLVKDISKEDSQYEEKCRHLLIQSLENDALDPAFWSLVFDPVISEYEVDKQMVELGIDTKPPVENSEDDQIIEHKIVEHEIAEVDLAPEWLKELENQNLEKKQKKKQAQSKKFEKAQINKVANEARKKAKKQSK